MFALIPVLAQVAAQPSPPPPHAPLVPTAPEIFTAFAIVVGAMIAMQIVANWVVSKMLATANSSFGNALKLWLLVLAGCIGAAVVAGLAFTAGAAMGAPWLQVVAVVVFILLVIYVSFSTAMKVYEISLIQAFIFILLSNLINSIVQFSALQVLPIVLKGTGTGAAFMALRKNDPAMQNASIAWVRKNAPSLVPYLDAADARLAANRTKPIAVRRAALQRMRDALEERRLALNPKDPTAVAAYKHDAQEYSKWYHDVETEAAQPGAKP